MCVASRVRSQWRLESALLYLSKKDRPEEYPILLYGDTLSVFVLPIFRAVRPMVHKRIHD